MVRIIILATWVVIAGCSPVLDKPVIEPAALRLETMGHEDQALQYRIGQIQRLLSVSWPIRHANADLCPVTTYDYGFSALSLHHVQPELHTAFHRVYGLDQHDAVLHITDDSPADKAGLEIGDRILSGGKVGEPSRPDWWNHPNGNHILSLHILRNDTKRWIDIHPAKLCGYPVLWRNRALAKDETSDHIGDASAILVSSRFLHDVKDDNVLALIIAHGQAHHSLRELEKGKIPTLLADAVNQWTSALSGHATDWSRVNGKLYSQSFETHADYLSVYFAARAGYDISDVANIWRQIAIQSPEDIHFHPAVSHPAHAQRFIVVKNARRDIHHQRDHGKPLIPKINQAFAAP